MRRQEVHLHYSSSILGKTVLRLASHYSNDGDGQMILSSNSLGCLCFAPVSCLSSVIRATSVPGVGLTHVVCVCSDLRTQMCVGDRRLPFNEGGEI